MPITVARLSHSGSQILYFDFVSGKRGLFIQVYLQKPDQK